MSLDSFTPLGRVGFFRWGQLAPGKEETFVKNLAILGMIMVVESVIKLNSATR